MGPLPINYTNSFQPTNTPTPKTLTANTVVINKTCTEQSIDGGGSLHSIQISYPFKCLFLITGI
eukprot:m.126455 g.126455  ORF g.126455 m.126455 type:complete len:64 (+) comp12994_c0_seq1:436-627(+)